jgi:serine/threonine protein kinase
MNEVLQPGLQAGGSGVDTHHSTAPAASSTVCPGANAPSAATTADPAAAVTGRKLGKYQLSSLLGKGGMGEVYKGFDPLVERYVAIKVLPASLTSNATALQRFLAEARASGKLIHPHAVALYEIGEQDGSYYLVMEFVAGGSIAGMIAKRGRIPWQQAALLGSQLCRGLAAAHQVGLIHRDIKPDNLLCSAEDCCKITDFGLAKATETSEGSSLNMTKPGDLLGTPYYMSPEQFNGSQVDLRSDIYSAGGTIYHMLTGSPPYHESTNIIQVMYAHCNNPPPDPRKLAPEVPQALVDILTKAMAKNPQDRYASANEMADCLTAIAGSVNLARSGSASAAAVATTAPAPVAAMPPALAQSLSGMPLSIWVVEPSGLQQKILTKHFHGLGVSDVRVFPNLAETMAELGHSTPTALFTAMHLPDGTGDDLARALLSSPMGAKIYCFLISSDAQASAPTSFYPGRPLILPKPVTQETLMQALQRIRAR